MLDVMFAVVLAILQKFELLKSHYSMITILETMLSKINKKLIVKKTLQLKNKKLKTNKN